MGQGSGRLARSHRVQLTPIPQADSKQFAAAEQECMAGRTPELLYRQVEFSVGVDSLCMASIEQRKHRTPQTAQAYYVFVGTI